MSGIVLVIGAYGFIGAAVARRLLAEGLSVRGLGRDPAQARRILPQIDWATGDLTRMEASDWQAALAGVDVVVNAAGALQNGVRDHVDSVHDRAIDHLLSACETAQVRRIVQISAVGVGPHAETAFLRSKAAGGARLMAAPIDWVILRPGLVIGRGAYGGTALLRALAAVPWATPLVHAESRMQTVALDDVVEAVSLSVRGEVPTGTCADLVEPKAHTLAEVVTAIRAWQGFAPAPAVALPAGATAPVGWAADAARWLGWRSPLRSTAQRVLAEGVTGDPGPWHAATGKTCRPLAATLDRMPAHVQDRWFGALYLLRPLVLLSLALLWIVSGAVALWRPEEAAAVLTPAGAGPWILLTVAGGAADLVIGAGLLVRRWSRLAAMASLGRAVGGARQGDPDACNTHGREGTGRTASASQRKSRVTAPAYCHPIRAVRRSRCPLRQPPHKGGSSARPDRRKRMDRAARAVAPRLLRHARAPGNSPHPPRTGSPPTGP